MVENNIHIIVTGESGRGRTLLFSKGRLRRTVFASIAGVLLLAGMSVAGLYSLHRNSALKGQIVDLTARLQHKQREVQEKFGDAENALRQELAEVRQALEQSRRKVAGLTKQYKQDKSDLITRYEQQINELKTRQDAVLADSISRLEERRKVIEAIMDSIGVELKVEEDPQHSGGPFIQADNGAYGERLISYTDQYLKVLRTVPLGRPIMTSISSRYGRRRDPINHRWAFHAGIDFRGRVGDPVLATAAGTVNKAGRNSGYGRCVIIDHGNGYQTVFGHLSKYRVKKGDVVTRGQVVGLLGNSGRSTGSHLHYEIRYHGKSVNPLKYLKVAGRILKVAH